MKNKLKQNMGSVCILVGAGAAILIGTSPVFAGFEWKPPAAVATPAPVVAVPPPPVVMLDGDKGINWSGEPAPLNMMKVEPAPIGVPLSPSGAKPGAMAAVGNVSGFGADLPLVVALQQIAPPEYTFSFAPGVDPGTHVSWQGDKPWEQVMADMLAPKNLDFKAQGNVVMITAAAEKPLPPLMTPSAPVETMPAEMAPVPLIRQQESALPPPSFGTPPSTSYSKADAVPHDLLSPAEAAAAPKEYMIPPDLVAKDSGKNTPVTLRREKPVDLEPMPVVKKEPPAPAFPAVEPVKAVSTPKDITENKAVEPLPLLPPAAEVVAVGEVAPVKPVSDANNIPEFIFTSPDMPKWQVAKGKTLRETLSAWSKAAQVELYWAVAFDYRMNADASYQGSFEDAVEQLLNQFATVRPQPYGRLHQGPDNSNVLVINSYDLPK